MKKIILLVVLLLTLVTLLSACVEQPKDSVGATTGFTTGTSTAESATAANNGNTAEILGVVKVQDSKNIAVAENAEYLSVEDTQKVIAIYKNGYEPFVSKMVDGVLVAGVLEVSFETDYDVSKCSLYRIGRVVDHNDDTELSAYSGQKPKVKRDGRKLTIDVGWWHESSGWEKSYPVWSYIICVEDIAGTFHNYYFRVEYTTTDPVGLSTEKDYEAFIRNNGWYTRALGCIFEKPEDIPAWFYFYGGVGDYAQATGEELAFTLDAFQKKNPNTENLDYAHEYTRLPVAKMNEALTVLGVTVEDIQIPDRWVYYDKTDSYYFWVSDAYGVEGWYVTRVEKGTEGTVAVYWETKGYYWGNPTLKEPLRGAKMVYTMQLQPDGTYRVLSNLPEA